MSLQTSIDENQGYLECLKDLSTYLKQVEKLEGGPPTQKEIEEHFIKVQKKQCDKNIGKILDELVMEFEKEHYVEEIKVGMPVTNLKGSYLGTVKEINRSGLTALVKDSAHYKGTHLLSKLLPANKKYKS